MDFSYVFPAVRGVQAGKEYYVTMIPLKYLVKILPEPGDYLLPEYRAQRRINEKRIPGMKSYILDNRETYIFSSLTASLDGQFHFEQTGDDNIGFLHISMDTRILINDGQHRRAAIAQALLEDDSLNEETISVVLYEDRGLKQSQQMFTDLNMNAQKSSNSINTCYETREPLAILTRNIVASNPFLNRYTDLERDNLGKNSSALFTLYTIYRVNKKIVGTTDVSDDDECFLEMFWNYVTDNIPEWKELENRCMTKRDLRENYVVTLGVTLLSFSRLGGWLYSNPSENMEKYLVKLSDVDWSRTNSIWRDRMIRSDGKIMNNDNAVYLVGNAIKKIIGMPLTKEEQKREDKFRQGINHE